jgi:UDP-glucose 4-epimerase
MSAKTQIVTGAAGFIGSHLVDRLLDLGHDVIGIDNLARGRRDFLAGAEATGRFHFIELDLMEAAALETAFADAGEVETVWHLAANSDIPAGVADARVDWRDTFMTTFNVVETMKRSGTPRLVFASTSAVYGALDQVLDETTGPLLPISNYGAMKLAGEGVVSAAVESHLKQAVICRFPNVVGPRATHGVIYDLVGKLLGQARELEVLGDGRQCKPYLHVSELVEAMIHLWSTQVDSRVLCNIGPEDDGATVAAIARAVVEAAGGDTPLRYTGGDRGWLGDVPRVRYAVERLKTSGWAPSLSSEEAVRRAAGEVARERGLTGE